jgi:hypothetical protein
LGSPRLARRHALPMMRHTVLHVGRDQGPCQYGHTVAFGLRPSEGRQGRPWGKPPTFGQLTPRRRAQLSDRSVSVARTRHRRQRPDDWPSDLASGRGIAVPILEGELRTEGSLGMSRSGVIASVCVAVLVAAMTSVGLPEHATSRRSTSQLAALTKPVRYGSISLLVPKDWATYGTPPVVVFHAGADHTDDGTITLEPFLSTRGPDTPAMSRYHHGPWKTSRSTFGFAVEDWNDREQPRPGARYRPVHRVGEDPRLQHRPGLSGPGHAADLALVLTRAVLMTLVLRLSLER